MPVRLDAGVQSRTSSETEVRLTPDAARERISELLAEIAYHDDLYYRKAAPEISDAAYDALKRELRALEAAYPEIATSLSQASGVGDDRTGDFPQRRHPVPMLSLDKAYSDSEVADFYERMTKAARSDDLRFLVEPKVDGMAISVTYKKGTLAYAVTRGNGDFGDDITANVLNISSVPHQLAASDYAQIPDTVELRGEIHVTFADFDAVNERRQAEGEVPYAHPRNYAAGSAKLTDPDEVADRSLSVVFFGYGVYEPKEMAPTSQSAFYRQMAVWGAPTLAKITSVCGLDALVATVKSVQSDRMAFPFPIDGAVIKVDEIALQRQLGCSNTAPRWALAFKFSPERVATRLLGITLQVGRTGLITPVAELRPVEIGGTRIARATLSNAKAVRESDFRIGDSVYLEKAGEVIPSIAGLDLNRRPAGAKRFALPTKCPSCGSDLEVESGGAIIRCVNVDCPAQLQRRLEHFASSGAVDIEGLGFATVEKLIAGGVVANVADLYRLNADKLERAGLGTGVTATSLLAAIAESKDAPLWRVVYGLSIPGMGSARSKAIAAEAGNLNALLGVVSDAARAERMEYSSGIGPSAMASLKTYLGRADGRDEIQQLVTLGIGCGNVVVADAANARPLANLAFVVTGTLPDMTRSEVTRLIESAGGVVRSRISGATDYVVVGDKPGSKATKARELGVTELSEMELLKMMGR